MGFLKSLASSMATKIGYVVGGDYKGAKVGYGLKNEKKFSISVGPVNKDEALIFFTKPDNYRFDRDDVSSYSVKTSTPTTTTYEILFKDGKRSIVEILNQYKVKVDSALY